MRDRTCLRGKYRQRQSTLFTSATFSFLFPLLPSLCLSSAFSEVSAFGILPEVLPAKAWPALILPAVLVLEAVFLPPGVWADVLAVEVSGAEIQTGAYAAEGSGASEAILPPMPSGLESPVASGVRPPSAKAWAGAGLQPGAWRPWNPAEPLWGVLF